MYSILEYLSRVLLYIQQVPPKQKMCPSSGVEKNMFPYHMTST